MESWGDVPILPVRTRRIIEWTAYLFILPAFIIVGAFHIFPVFYAIYISLNQGAINQFHFVGLQNYLQALTGSDFWSSLATTFIYAFMTLPVTIFLGLFFAYLLYQRVRGRGIYRTLFFLPYVISTVGSSIIWAWVFNPENGLANHLLSLAGIQPLRWLIEPSGVFGVLAAQFNWTIPSWAQGPSLALVAVSIFTVWQSMGYDVVLFLAGLTSLPGELYEAARIDGANAVQLFRFITLPLLAPTTFFVVVVSVIASLQSFNQIFAMNTAAAQTLGGPLETTNTLTVYMFNQLYTYSNYGYASALAVLLSLIILALTLLNFRLLGRRAEA
ncbi:MAG: sugar ABC transporter permease [Chloroflexi bacterium]|nr:sugar ABC transporter permease [Chloroflexota bacterium]